MNRKDFRKARKELKDIVLPGLFCAYFAQTQKLCAC